MIDQPQPVIPDPGEAAFAHLLLTWLQQRESVAPAALHAAGNRVEDAAAAVTAATARLTAARRTVAGLSEILHTAEQRAHAACERLSRHGVQIARCGNRVDLACPSGARGTAFKIGLSWSGDTLHISVSGNEDPFLFGIVATIAGAGRWDELPALLQLPLGAAEQSAAEGEQAHRDFVMLATMPTRMALADAELAVVTARQELLASAQALQDATSRQTDLLARYRYLARAAEDFLAEARRQYRLICRLPGVTHVEAVDGLVRITTAPLLVAHRGSCHELGSFIIELDASRGALRVYNLTHRRGHRGSYDHPHVADGVPCLGTIRELITRKLGEGDIAAVAVAMLEFLRSYSPRTAYVDLAEWPVVPLASRPR